MNQHWVVPFKYTNGSGWDSNRDRFSNQCHRTDTNWQVNATKRACLSGRGYCPNAVHQPAGSLYTVQHNNGFPCAAYRYFDPSQQRPALTHGLPALRRLNYGIHQQTRRRLTLDLKPGSGSSNLQTSAKIQRIKICTRPLRRLRPRR